MELPMEDLLQPGDCPRHTPIAGGGGSCGSSHCSREERRWRVNWALKDRERVERRHGGRGGLPAGPGDGAGVIVLTFVVPGPAPDPVSSPPSLAQLPRPSVLLPFSH